MEDPSDCIEFNVVLISYDSLLLYIWFVVFADDNDDDDDDDDQSLHLISFGKNECKNAFFSVAF